LFRPEPVLFWLTPAAATNDVLTAINTVQEIIAVIRFVETQLFLMEGNRTAAAAAASDTVNVDDRCLPSLQLSLFTTAEEKSKH